MGNAIRELTDGVVLRETQPVPIRSIDPKVVEAHRQAEAIAATSRTAHRVASEVRAAMRGATVEDVASFLGVAIAKRLDGTLGGQLFEPRISQDERDRYGYGKLPDDLIRTVNGSVSRLTSEYGTLERNRRFAVSTMKIVSQDLAILPGHLRERILEELPESAIPLPGTMDEIELATVGSVIAVAHYQTVQYYAHNESQGE